MTVPLDLLNPIPTWPQVQGWSVAHLEALRDALKAWIKAQMAARTAHTSNMMSPGGTDWDGDAGDAATALASNDNNVVEAQIGIATQTMTLLNEAIGEQLQKQATIVDAVQQVQAKGGSVAPNWNVTYPNRFGEASRKLEAGQDKDYLQMLAQNLQLADNATAGQLGNEMKALQAEQFSQTGRFQVQPVDNKTPKPDPDQQAQPAQTHALDQKDKPAAPAPDPQPDPAARFGSQPRLDPSTPEGRKQLEDIRQQMQGPASPTAPPLATSGGPLQGVPVAPSVPRPEAPIPPPAPPGFMDGVAAAASDMVNHLADTAGFHGTEAAKNAFIQNAVAMFLQANPNIAGPVNTMNMTRDAMEHPQPASYLAGRQAFDTWFKLAGIALPEAGGLGRLGAEGAGAGTLAGGLGRAPEGVGTRAPLGEPRPLGPEERPAAKPGESAPRAPIDESPPHDPAAYDPHAPQTATQLNDAFSHGKPTADLSRQLADQSTHRITSPTGDPAKTDRVVLGKWDGQDGGYIGEARHDGGIYYDTGNDTWKSLTGGLGETQGKALGWQVNEQFLRAQMENHVSRIDFVLPKGFDNVEQLAREQRESYSAMEINFLKEHGAEYGYKQHGNSWIYEGGK